MVLNLVGSLVLMSCLGCGEVKPASSIEFSLSGAYPMAAAEAAIADNRRAMFPIELIASESLDGETSSGLSPFGSGPGSSFGSVRLGAVDAYAASRFRRLQLAAPTPLGATGSDSLHAGFAVNAAGEWAGVGLQVQVSPRASFERTGAGDAITNLGAEIRFTGRLLGGDTGRAVPKTHAWYFFAGSDNRALVLNFADGRSAGGVALQDQVTVGDAHAGLAWAAGPGAQWSFGVVERKYEFSGFSQERDLSVRERYAAVSFTLRR